jgi:hypothetical protein
MVSYLSVGSTFLAGAGAIAATLLLATSDQAAAASSDACEGGGFTITGLVDGSTVGEGETTIPAANLGPSFLVQGRYIEFRVVMRNFAIRNYLFTGAPNPEDITGGRRTVVWTRKTPLHRGLVLNSDVQVEIGEDELVITRNGTGGLTMKIQAKDCAQGGIFQMEPERGDHTTTRFVHVLAPGAFYFDNPNFRAREGDTVPYKDTTVVVPARVNIANDLSPDFVARDSAQVAERVDEPTCRNLIPTRTGALDEVLHCGGVSRWDVASGGRMGFVTGEDAVEVAPPATDCIQNCQAQNRVRGQAVVLGFPFPVPQNVRLQPRTP